MTAILRSLPVRLSLTAGKTISVTGQRSPARVAALWFFFLLPLGLLGGLFSPATNATDSRATVNPRIIRVGAKQSVTTIAGAARIAVDGDTVEVDAGDYLGDVATWRQNNLTLRAVGGRARLIAAGTSAENKGIWVIRGGTIQVEGFDFLGARVPDRNGAGIRLEKGRLKIRDCRFLENENGILTGGDAETTLDISNSEFGNNGSGDGQSHNLYVGAIARLTVSGSYFHHAKVGHLLKSRARENDIRYNRLTDEIGGRASYELEFPSGGVTYVVGNIIQQSSTTENPHLISYAAEGYRFPRNELYLINNTLIDLRPQGGVFLRVKPGQVKVVAQNNLLLGDSTLEKAGPGAYGNNFKVDFDEFVRAVREDYRLAPASRLIGRGLPVDAAGQAGLQPVREYVHPRSTRPTQQLPLSPGALQTTGP